MDSIHYGPDGLKVLLLASTNQGKVAEFQRLLAPLGIAVRSPADLGLALEVEETGETFAENAALKAEAYLAASGLPSLADDSGLSVAGLEGAPGVRSARYGGPGLTDAQRTDLLVAAMRGRINREARFVCDLALALPGRPPLHFTGTVAGEVTHEPRGEGGFGYDPIFLYPPLGRTFGELRPEEKDAVSHRAEAARQLVRYLQNGRYTE